MKIKAAVLNKMGAEAPYAKSKPLAIEELELDDPSHGEVLVKIAAAGLCHSDLSVIDGNRPRPTPMVLGHEAAGIVEKLGPAVDDLKLGDHVVMVFVPSCGHCLPCAEGRPALCEPGAAANGAGTLLSGQRRLHRNGTDVHHHLGVSAFAEYATVSRRSLVKIEKGLPLDEAALFGCAVLTGVGAVINTAKVSAGASVAVIGLGGVGLSCLLGAVAVGARRIVAVDLSDDKLGLARQLGATDTFNPGNAGAVDEIRSATGGGVEFAFEMAGRGALPAPISLAATGTPTAIASAGRSWLDRWKVLFPSRSSRRSVACGSNSVTDSARSMYSSRSVSSSRWKASSPISSRALMSMMTRRAASTARRWISSCVNPGTPAPSAPASS